VREKPVVSIDRDIDEYLEKERSRGNFKEYFEKSKAEYAKGQNQIINEYLTTSIDKK
jgi:hypothetical protein